MDANSPGRVRQACVKSHSFGTTAEAASQVPATRPVAFLDRDGVLNVDVGHTHRLSDLTWMDGAPEAITFLNRLGYRVAVVTNQAGIAKGYYSDDEFRGFMGHVLSELSSRGGHVDAVYYCPHHPDAVLEGLRVDCHCRKPRPGMILRGLQDLQGRIDGSFLVGDRASDIAAAEGAGLPGYLFDGTVSLLDFVTAIVDEQRASLGRGVSGAAL